MRSEVTSDLWWKDAVIYGVDVKSFEVKVDLGAAGVEELLADRHERPLPNQGSPIPLEPYGWRWLRPRQNSVGRT
jgi:hypothetical protein